jgi:hypothetical protein
VLPNGRIFGRITKKGRIKIEEDWPEKVAVNFVDFVQKGKKGPNF